jgi:DNA-binding transcriptional LysR family regulator
VEGASRRPRSAQAQLQLPRLQHPLLYDAANGRPFEWEFRNEREVLSIKVTSRLMVSDVGAMLSACEAGVGIAQISSSGRSKSSTAAG